MHKLQESDWATFQSRRHLGSSRLPVAIAIRRNVGCMYQGLKNIPYIGWMTLDMSEMLFVRRPIYIYIYVPQVGAPQ